jgi:BMFP domain-containing protein YqiC
LISSSFQRAAAMDNREFLDNLSKKISQLLPRAAELGEEGRQALRQLLQKSFTELNILTREEFESRDRALRRAEQRIDELERLVGELEARLDNLSDSGRSP